MCIYLSTFTTQDMTESIYLLNISIIIAKVAEIIKNFSVQFTAL